MGSLIKIDPINKDTLDDRIKSFDERLNVLFDYTKTDFTIMSYDNSRKLFFSKCQESKVTAEVITTYKDYHDDIAKFFDENTKNIAKGLIENTEIFSMIVDVVFVPELVAVNFVTAGYIILCQPLLFLFSIPETACSFMIVHISKSGSNLDIIQQILIRHKC